MAHRTIDFDDAIAEAKAKIKQRRQNISLLLGNGFSAKYFSYASLLDSAVFKRDDPLRELFDHLATVDFERVVKALQDAAQVELAYGKRIHARELNRDARRLRRILVNAIRNTHPSHRADIEDEIPSCVKFLNHFNDVFTLNYDLLLYWVSLDAKARLADGFGLGRRRNGFIGPFSPGAHCDIYNLHGGLHLFRDGIDVRKRVHQGDGVIDAIAHTILHDNRLPLYVAEGDSAAKLERIKSSPYLSHCYDKLSDSAGALFVYGHSAHTNDAHIYSAIFHSGIKHLYFCVHKPTPAKLRKFAGELARYRERADSEIKWTFVDSASAYVWDEPPSKSKHKHIRPH